MPCRLAGGACEARLGLDLGADLRRRGGAVAATRGAVGGDVEVRLVERPRGVGVQVDDI